MVINLDLMSIIIVAAPAVDTGTTISYLAESSSVVVLPGKDVQSGSRSSEAAVRDEDKLREETWN